jgi:hypothetical protein
VEEFGNDHRVVGGAGTIADGGSSGGETVFGCAVEGVSDGNDAGGEGERLAAEAQWAGAVPAFTRGGDSDGHVATAGDAPEEGGGDGAGGSIGWAVTEARGSERDSDGVEETSKDDIVGFPGRDGERFGE